MVTKDLRKLLQKLDGYSTRMLEAAAGFCISRGHYEVGPEHLLLKYLEDGSGDVNRILSHFEVESEKLWDVLLLQLEQHRTGNTGRPSFSPVLLQLIEEAWIICSVHHGDAEIRSGHLLEALLQSDRYKADEVGRLLSKIKSEDLRENLYDIVSGSSEDRSTLKAGGPKAAGQPKKAGETALDLYTLNVTAKARAGEIDPVFGRDHEVRQIIDILGRRRKNNPILVGEPGVGKTAVVEGLALRIADGDVPDKIKEVDIVSLDLGLLQAGAGVKGEFENRLKSVIQEVREASKPIIMFIDEAHTLIGAGGAAGTGDAANLLKPALARGELRTIAATTWSEYKKYIEKDPALERRFQMVKIDEPSAEVAAVMLRGIKSKYEDHHSVQITDEAIHSAAVLSDRFIAGRHLPDKAVDLMDTASARVKLTQTAKPAAVDDLERRVLNLTINIDALRRDIDTGLLHNDESLRAFELEREELLTKKVTLEERWKEEREATAQVDDLRRQISALVKSNGSTQDDGLADLRKRLMDVQLRLRELHGDDEALVHAEVNEHIVARVVSDWTGIPMGNMLKDEAVTLLDLENRMSHVIRGQDDPLGEIADSIRSAKAGLGNPDAPIAVFLLIGPSGVGKTEAARMLAEMLFGGERFLTTINMSEYQESHTVSQLKGSPPGYVGYGEGGVLTEAVRRRPYSVVLLDEVEKAHTDVMELFYQVFDKGFMRDGEGREVNFRNAVIMMTSNIGSDAFLQVCTEDEHPSTDQLRELAHHFLTKHFQPALLGRMKVVPFYPLRKDTMKEIARLKLAKIAKRLHDTHAIAFEFGDDIVERIADRCTQIDSGARNIDFIIDRNLLPEASRALLSRMAAEDMPSGLALGINEEGDFTYTFEDGTTNGKPKKKAKSKAKAKT